jgi:hypothetical protein
MPTVHTMSNAFPLRSSRLNPLQGSGRGRALAYPSCPLPLGGNQAPALAASPQPLTWEELLGQR